MSLQKEQHFLQNVLISGVQVPTRFVKSVDLKIRYSVFTALWLDDTLLYDAYDLIF